MKKICVCGKGGGGKSTVVAPLSRKLCERGRRVFVIDVDESNVGLYRGRISIIDFAEGLVSLTGSAARRMSTVP